MASVANKLALSTKTDGMSVKHTSNNAGCASSPSNSSGSASKDDPFVVKTPSKLSATAPAFTPGAAAGLFTPVSGGVFTPIGARVSQNGPKGYHAANRGSFKRHEKPVFMPVKGGNSMMMAPNNVLPPPGFHELPPPGFPDDELPPPGFHEVSPEQTAMLYKLVIEADNKYDYHVGDVRLLKFGVFSWDRGSYRTIKISAKLPGVVVPAAVSQTLTVRYPNTICYSANSGAVCEGSP